MRETTFVHNTGPQDTHGRRRGNKIRQRCSEEMWQRVTVGRDGAPAGRWCAARKSNHDDEVYKTSREREGSMVAHKDPTFVDGSEQSVTKSSGACGDGQRVRSPRGTADQADE